MKITRLMEEILISATTILILIGVISITYLFIQGGKI
jgi:hypothetical protein